MPDNPTSEPRMIRTGKIHIDMTSGHMVVSGRLNFMEEGTSQFDEFLAKKAKETPALPVDGQ